MPPGGQWLVVLVAAVVTGCSAPEQSLSGSSTTFEATSGSSSGGATSEAPTTTSPPINSTALRNVDVSVIYPLPPVDEVERLLAATDAGNGGPLLPPALFADGVPELDERTPLADDAARLATLRVVAVRFDPCPGELAPPPAGTVCQPDIRLVFQSLMPGPTSLIARDGALHGFYRLTPDAFAAVLDELRDIRAEHVSDPEVPLDVHPLLLSTGLAGAYAQRLAALVVKYAGPATLVRVTEFRRLATPEVRWVFSLKEKPEGAWQNMQISTTGVTEQGLVTIVGGTWNAVLTPPVSHPDDVTKIFSLSDPVEMAAAFKPVVRVLHPGVHSSESIDCATCHITPDVAVFARSTQSLDVADYPERFTSSYPLDFVGKSVGDSIGFENMHMMSYLGGSLSITARVANETAAVLEIIQGEYGE